MSKPLFILAPMDDVTDTVFRRIVADCAAPDFTMTEFVNVDGLCSPGRSRLIRKLDTSLDSVPVIAQIWGKKPENFETIAREIASGDIPGFSGIDINFGCPAKSEIKADCCSALQKIELRPEAKAMITATIRGIKTARGPSSSKELTKLSFKTRLGFDHVDYSWHEFLLGFKPSLLTVHVRTTKQMSKVPAQWEAIIPIVQLRDKLSPETKIIMNGDIADKQHGLAIVDTYGVDGVMIGRGIFQNPYCFDDNAQEKWGDVSESERIDHFKRHVLLHEEQWPDNAKPFNPLKKFAKVYISEFSGAADLRAKIMATETAQEALAVL